MGAEQEIEWVRGKEGREEVGENRSERRKDESGQERRKEPRKNDSLNVSPFVAAFMNIACVIRQQGRWCLNGLLTRPLNTGSVMVRWQ